MTTSPAEPVDNAQPDDVSGPKTGSGDGQAVAEDMVGGEDLTAPSGDPLNDVLDLQDPSNSDIDTDPDARLDPNGNNPVSTTEDE